MLELSQWEHKCHSNSMTRNGKEYGKEEETGNLNPYCYLLIVFHLEKC